MIAHFWVLLCLNGGIMNEFSRIETLIGKNKLSLIKSKTVMIIGLGGVGGYALETLVRNGIENVIIVDFDKVDITNINRQIIALHSTINENKTDMFFNRIKDINPNCNVVIINKFIDENNINNLFENKIDYVIDACDTVDTKKLIIKKCLDNKIKFISCMGTAKKLDPTKLEVVDIRKTSYDKLAKIIRKWVKDEEIKDKIFVVSSKEKVIDNFENTKVLGSMSFVPNIAGILCAKYIIDDVISE